MHRTLTPTHRTLLSRPSGTPIAPTVLGTVTILWLAGLVRPGGIAAQSTGMMQVEASVIPAEAAWAGLSAAQQIAREFAATPLTGGAQRADLSLTSIRFEVPLGTPADDPAQPAISIQFLRN
jgi:hypothetical protein